MRNSRNTNGRSRRSSRQFSDQDQYGNSNQYGSYRGSGDSGYREEGDYDREDYDRGQGRQMDQDYNRGNFSRGGYQDQEYGYDRGMRNDYGNNSYTDNEGYNNEGYNQGFGGSPGQYGQGRFDRGNESNDWRRNQWSGQQSSGQESWRESSGYGNGPWTNESRGSFGMDSGRMGNQGRSNSGGSQRGSNGNRGSSSFDTTRGGQWGSSVESMRGKGPKGYRRPDDRIQEQLNDTLTDDDMLDASGIEVTVKNGEVTLSGTVSSREDKRRAEDLAEALSGVTNVENRLRVSTDKSENRGSQDRSAQESDKSKTQNKPKTHQNAEA